MSVDVAKITRILEESIDFLGYWPAENLEVATPDVVESLPDDGYQRDADYLVVLIRRFEVTLDEIKGHRAASKRSLQSYTGVLSGHKAPGMPAGSIPRSSEEIDAAVDSTQSGRARKRSEKKNWVGWVFIGSRATISGLMVLSAGTAVGPLVTAAVTLLVLETCYNYHKIMSDKESTEEQKRQLKKELWKKTAFTATTQSLAGLSILDLGTALDGLIVGATAINVILKSGSTQKQRKADIERALETGQISKDEAYRLLRKAKRSILLDSGTAFLDAYFDIREPAGKELYSAVGLATGIILVKYVSKLRERRRDVNVHYRRGEISRGEAKRRKRAEYVEDANEASDEALKTFVKRFKGKNGLDLAVGVAAATVLILAKYSRKRRHRNRGINDRHVAGELTRKEARDLKRANWNDSQAQQALSFLGILGQMKVLDSKENFIGAAVAATWIIGANYQAKTRRRNYDKFGPHTKRQYTLVKLTSEFGKGMLDSGVELFGKTVVGWQAGTTIYSTTVKDAVGVHATFGKVREIWAVHRIKDRAERRKQFLERLESLGDSSEWSGITLKKADSSTGETQELIIPAESIEAAIIVMLHGWNEFRHLWERRRYK